ncbi:MAG: hypothetical protein WBH75_20305 [Thermoanaerobaculia bacterium]
MIVVIALLAVVEWGGRTVISRSLLPTRDAEWIWAPGMKGEPSPVRFFLVRQFELPFAVSDARLLARADEEYEVHLNGTWVGSNRYAAGTVDAYDAGSLLQPGTNTLLVELRSTRGIGGLLFSLEINGTQGEVLRIVSDDSWEVVGRGLRGLFGNRQELVLEEAVEVLGKPPVGRWGLPRAAISKPTVADLRVGDRPLAAERVLVGPDNEPWGGQGRIQRRSTRFRWWVTFDWGREVTGYLRFRFPAKGGTRGLVIVGVEPPDNKRQPADTFLMSLEGRRYWTDSQPRRFRYATFVGLGSVQGAEVILTDPDASLPWLAEKRTPEGVFGLETGSLRTPLEDKIWSQLQRVPGLGRREER